VRSETERDGKAGESNPSPLTYSIGRLGRVSCRWIVTPAADIYDPALNPLYRDVLAHDGVVALPCRVGDPDRKGKVESAIGHMQTALKGLRQDFTRTCADHVQDLVGHRRRRHAALPERERTDVAGPRGKHLGMSEDGATSVVSYLAREGKVRICLVAVPA
jgi:hypothetical protein